MSASRSIFLPFLYPVLFKPPIASSTASRCSATVRTRAPRKPRRRIAQFSTTRCLAEQARTRYGTANEPVFNPTEKDGKASSVTSTTDGAQKDAKAKPTDQQQEIVEEEDEESQETPLKPPDVTAKSKPPETSIETPTTPPPKAPSTPEPAPMETVLHMPSPSESASKHPHLAAPPYVHHFDTFGLVKQLEGSGFTADQSVTIMKSVRAMLTDNMALARDGLVSKSNVENETYLFKAACSELRTEVQSNRRAELEKMRTERTHLQHELDILNQKFGQDTQVMKDELKGLFDDRKMSVRMEQRKVDGQIQYLNSKITVALNSDARSEVESLRWVLTRRAAMALGICAILILSTLRYNSYMTQTQAAERKALEEKIRREMESGEHNSGGNGGAEVKAGNAAEETGGEGLIASEGGGRGYVSLG